MSRIGRAPITVPAGVDVTIEGNLITVKGQKGTLNYTYNPILTVEKDGATIQVSRANDAPQSRALHGLTRTLINNMIIGVSTGYSKKLEIIGVGYRAQKSGKTLTMNLGHSHPIVFEESNGVTFDVPDSTTVIVNGPDKQVVGQVAAEIRSKRPPEPYLGKGVKYSGERIRRKSGKAGK